MKVKKLASGKGLACSDWPDGVGICVGIKVDMTFDFVDMLVEARELESVHGADKSGGYTLFDPLRKLIRYKEYKITQGNRDSSMEATLHS